MEDGCDKAAVLRLMLGYSISKPLHLQPLQLDDSLVLLNGWYDKSLRVVFLHLVGCQDQAFLNSEAVNDLYEKKDSVAATSLLDQQYKRALLFVFSMSHFVLWRFTTHVLDTTCITTLRSLHEIRTEVLQAVSSALQEVGDVPLSWVNCGRLCCPRLLFLFSDAFLDAEELAHQLGPEGEPVSVDNALRTVERSLEDQIYRLMRRTWIITNNTANALVSLPPRKQYVYLVSRQQQSIPTQDQALSALEQLCSGSFQESAAAVDLMRCSLHALDNAQLLDDSGVAQRSGGGAAVTRKKQRALPDVLALNLLNAHISDRETNNERRFSSFLQQHISSALSGGFDDNVGRSNTVPVFVLPKLATWLSAANRLYQLFITPEKDETLSADVLERLTLESSELKFVRNTCRKAYESALGFYTFNVPQHYPVHTHQDKLLESIACYRRLSCACAFTKEFEERLVRECEQHWQDGRLGCEQLSLTGHICQCPRQDHPTLLHEPSGKELPDHKFGAQFVKHCNCGHSKGRMQDSVVLRALNHDFYAQLEEVCCGQLERYCFPSRENYPPDKGDKSSMPRRTQSVWERMSVPELPGSEDGSESSADVSEVSKIRDEDSSADEAEHSLSDDHEINEDQDKEKQPLQDDETDDHGSHEQLPDDGYEPHHRSAETASNLAAAMAELQLDDTNDGRAKQEQSITRVHSHQIFTADEDALDPMVSSDSPPDFVPLYSSWSLVCVGASSLYSHTIGIIDQPGFVSSSNFLLPWDYTVKVHNRSDWRAIEQRLGRKSKEKINIKGNEFSVKIFIGTEYECSAGHRFLMSGPKTPLYSKQGHPTISGRTIALSAICPLYHPCICRETKTLGLHLAQLTRLHVVTPKAPVHVILNPRIQPGSAPCPTYFPIAGGDSGIELRPGHYWVMRLPSVYATDAGPFYPPDPSQQVGVENGCLLPGCFSVSEVTFKIL
ncbi:hypothetical protein HAZT_HAZT010898 [Hyalella azteca]|uniref:Nonsense-mediated mRNA decay factor SMG8 n=1 Tax=Hyalella azteca TaxID=294128 RepID=A0A6A0H9E2_HYAAZ|nr:hypothetical protein HAZT_HAZT010898 [Hyalella azteca]